MITPAVVRTIDKTLQDTPGGFTEIPLQINLKEKTAKKLSFKVPWDGVLYGFIRGKDELSKKAGLRFPLVCATLTEWEDHFALILETEEIRDYAAFKVKSDDVIYLLENCLRAPEQR